ncbi:Predicted arabinose efflux permease, MFS family [Lentzea fradiae]|uniref:Predicted arabinose efflux permease, MFS family n=1 Tax=Lentzea fradiae TaxID=200378 RepID=A0A1G8BJX4_9PSEU|nr:MFS transporter [Lentzea fradiae]SDH33515.1 Predicted arabinose efflux permease, MFS family [Lentzea fradiae]
MSVTQARPLRQNRDFRLLWTGAGISALGGTITGVTYPLLMIWYGGSPVQAGLVGFAALLPMLLLQLPAGVFVDRWDRRRVMITCDAVSFVSIGSVAVSLLFGTLWLPHLLVVAFLEGSAQIFYRLSERAAVRNVVEPEHLPAALSQNEARSRAAGLLGQPLGSALFALVRWAPFVFTALGHLVALLTLLLIRKEFQTSRESGRRDVRAEIAEGIRWLLGQRFLRSAVLLVGCTNVLFQVLSLSLAVTIRNSGGSPAVIGVIGAASGVGGVLGAMSGSWFVRRLRPGVVIIVVFAVWAAFMPLVALTTNPVLLGAVFAGMSFAGALINVMAGVYQVQVTPDGMQGRVGAVAGLLSSGANSFGALAAGFLLASLTVGSTVLGVSAVMAALAVTAGLSPVIRTTRYREGVTT